MGIQRRANRAPATSRDELQGLSFAVIRVRRAPALTIAPAMLGRLMPREGKFFDLFNAHAERIVQGAHELAQMIGSFDELDTHAQRIDAAERAADKITHECIALLHRTFITPFDRDQIHQLITAMDDILDLIQDVAESIALYDLRSVTPEAKQLAEICEQSAARVKATVALLTNIKD